MGKALPFLLLALLAVGCTGDRAPDRRMDRADSLTAVGDDSSLWAAKALLDSDSACAATFPTRRRMRYSLLRARVMNKAYIPFTTDSVAKAVAGWYALHGTPNERMEAWYLLGCAYRDLGDAPRAVESLNKAEASADTTARDCDYKTLARICGQKDFLYVGMNMPRARLAEIDKGVRYALIAKDTLAALLIYNHKFSVYNLLHKTDSSILVNDRAARMFDRIGRHDLAAMAIGCNIENYLKKGMLREARDAIRTYERESGLFKDGNIKEGREIFYSLKGSCFLATGQLDSAEYYFRKYQATDKGNDGQFFSARDLAELYEVKGVPDSIAKYAFRAMALNDSINDHLETDEIYRTNKVYSYNSSKAIAEREQRKNAALRDNMTRGGVVAAMLVVLAILTSRIWTRKKRLEMDKKDQRHAAALENLHRAYEAVLKDNQNLKEQEGTHEHTIATLKKTIADYETVLHTGTESDTDKRLRQSRVFSRFKQLRKEGKAPGEEDWRQLAELLEKTIPQFHDITNRNDNLTRDDYRVCMLTRYHFPPMDIDYFISFSATSNVNISVRRARLLRKIWGKEGNGKDFDRYIDAIS